MEKKYYLPSWLCTVFLILAFFFFFFFLNFKNLKFWVCLCYLLIIQIPCKRVVDLLDCWKGRFGNYHNRSIWEAIPSCIMQCVRSWREKCLMLWKLWVLGFGFENGGKCGTKDIMTIATMGFLFITYLKYKILLRFLNLYLFFSVGISHVYFLYTWVSLSSYLIKLFYI